MPIVKFAAVTRRDLAELDLFVGSYWYWDIDAPGQEAHDASCIAWLTVDLDRRGPVRVTYDRGAH